MRLLNTLKTTHRQILFPKGCLAWRYFKLFSLHGFSLLQPTQHLTWALGCSLPSISPCILLHLALPGLGTNIWARLICTTWLRTNWMSLPLSPPIVQLRYHILSCSLISTCFWEVEIGKVSFNASYLGQLNGSVSKGACCYQAGWHMSDPWDPRGGKDQCLQVVL